MKRAPLRSEPTPAIHARLSSWLKTIFVLAPLSYFYGHSYDDGYLNGLGLKDSLPPLSSNEYVYEGVVGFVSTVVYFGDAITPELLLGVLLYALGACLLLALLFYSVEVFPRFRSKAEHWSSIGLRCLRKISKGAFYSFFPLALYGAGLVVGVFLVSVVYYVVMPAYAVELAGRGEALKLFAKVRAGDASSHFPSASLKSSDGTSVSVLVIECRASEWCIVFDKERFRSEPKGSLVDIVGSTTGPRFKGKTSGKAAQTTMPASTAVR